MHVLSLFAPRVAPPAALSRTLQWDTDPSVLQLQADSELGYFHPPLCFLLSFFLNDKTPLHPRSFSLFVSPPVRTTVSLNLSLSGLPISVPYMPLLLSFSFFLSLVGFKRFQLVTLQLFARGSVWHWLIYPNQYRCREPFFITVSFKPKKWVSALYEYNIFTAKSLNVNTTEMCRSCGCLSHGLIFSRDASISICVDCHH